MSYCDNGPNIASNNTTKLNGSIVDTAQKSVEPVKVVIEEKVAQPIKNAAAPALAAPAVPVVPAAPVIPAPADVDIVVNKYARGNLLNNQGEIPATIQTGFYIFVAFGLVVIFYISYRSYR